MVHKNVLRYVLSNLQYHFQNNNSKNEVKFFNFKIQPYVLRYVLSNLHYLSQTNNSKNEVKYFNFKIQPYVLRYVLLVNNINLDHFQNNKSKNGMTNIKLDQQHESSNYQ